MLVRATPGGEPGTPKLTWLVFTPRLFMAVSASSIAAKDRTARTDEKSRLGQVNMSDIRGRGIRLERSGGSKSPREIPAAHGVSGYSGQSGRTRATKRWRTTRHP